MVEFPSREWAEEFCRALNESEGYRRSGRGWVWPILFVVTELPEELAAEAPSPSPGFVLHLENGACKGVEWVEDATRADAPFIISARFRDWLDVIEGRVNPVVALMRRKLVLKKGDFAAILRYPGAAIEMVRVAQRITGG